MAFSCGMFLKYEAFFVLQGHDGNAKKRTVLQ